MEVSDEILKEVEYVVSSAYRTKALKALKDGGKMPLEFSNDSGIRQNYISNILRQLRE